IGVPTLRERPDWVSPFLASAALSVLLGPAVAVEAGIRRELLDAQGGGSFSFANLAADLAGVAFADGVRHTPNVLMKLATSFSVTDFVPSGAGLREGISEEEFKQEFGSATDKRFRAELEKLGKRVLALPVYQNLAKDKKK